MNIYTFSEVRRKLSAALDEAQAEGALCRDGSEFEIAPVRKKFPLDIEGVDVGLSAEEIVSMLRESRERDRP